jgi:hypothetical protein
MIGENKIVSRRDFVVGILGLGMWHGRARIKRNGRRMATSHMRRLRLYVQHMYIASSWRRINSWTARARGNSLRRVLNKLEG